MSASKNPKILELKEFAAKYDWAAGIPMRMALANALVAQRTSLSADEFYSWDALRENLPLLPGGIFSGGADVQSEHCEHPLLVGVSGGADSVALLVSLIASQIDGLFSSITVCHINHRLRADESDADAEFCAQLAERLSLPFVSTVADDAQAQSFRMKGSENALRDFRYAAFEKHASLVGARVVALAHNLNDQIETMLFRAFRGTSAAGLRGIPCVRWQNDLLICRPLIDVSRLQITSLLKDLKLDWREDSSNAQLNYSRNFIRAQIIPRIESEFADFGLRLENMRRLMADDEEMLKTLCLSQISAVEGKNANSWQLAELTPLPVALKRRMFAQALRSRGIEVSFERVEKLIALVRGHNEIDLDYSNPAKQAVSLNERWDVLRAKDNLMFVDKIEKANNAAVVIGDPIPVKVPGMTIVPALNKVLFVDALEAAERKPKRFPSQEAFEAIVSLDKVKGPLVIRERQAGDLIQPFGMKEMVKLKKFLHTHKPEDEEASAKRQFVLASGEEVFWVPGVGISEKLRVTGLATHALKWLDIGIGATTLC
ncbi:MAG: tRNA lysidine(34) synthetase TilS [Candidatus Obscuribacterales bacterium]|nr:tRNA lysidine(34) synthetase TilS [Candidatus Obscuribacterales bacterium]